MRLQAVFKNRIFLGMLAWAMFHARLALLLWLLPRFGPPVLESLGLPNVLAAEPAPEVVRFRFSPITADVAEESRVDEAPDTPIQGRFDSIARDEVVDGADTPVPASDVTGPDNSIDGTGAEEEVAGDPFGQDDATPEASAAARAAEALSDGPALSPGAQERLPNSAQEMLTGQRPRLERPGFGERVSADFEERGAREFGGLSFSTYAWEFEPYWHHMRRKLYGAWYPPAAWMTYGIVSDGWTLVRAVIGKDGRLGDVSIVDQSGHESLHRAAFAAMVGAAPFRDLPSDFPDDSLVVHVRFEYTGVRPAQEDTP